MPTQQELKDQGNVHFQNGDFKKAIEFYTLAIEKDALCDEAAPILSNRSLCYYNIEKYKEAYEDAGFCCGIRPDWAKGFARRGVSAEKLGEFEIALESYDEYLKLDPTDALGIRANRNVLKPLLDQRGIKLQAEREHLQELDKQLKTSTPEERAPFATFFMIHYGKEINIFAKEMNVEGMRQALKWGARLDRFVDKNSNFDDIQKFVKNEKSQDELKRLYERDVKKGNFPSRISSILSFLLKPFEKHVDQLLAHGRHYQSHLRCPNLDLHKHLEFLLDIAQDQKDHSPLPCVAEIYLPILCFHCDATDAALVKDNVLSLLHNGRGKHLFFGNSKNKNNSNSNNVTESQFATMLLQAVLRNQMAEGIDTIRNMDKKNNNNSKRPSASSVIHHRDTSDAFQRDIYETILSCLNAGASVNSNFLIDSFADKNSHNLRQTFPCLSFAIENYRSPQIVELLLRKKASLEAGAKLCTDETTRIFSPLHAAFASHSTKMIQMMQSAGAAFVPVEECPDLVMEHQQICRTKTVLKPTCSSSMWAGFGSINPNTMQDDNSTTADNKTKISVNEHVRLLFDQLTRQNLSFLAPLFPSEEVSKNKLPVMYHTPLTLAIWQNFPPETIELMIRLQPELIRVPYFESDETMISPNLPDIDRSKVYFCRVTPLGQIAFLIVRGVDGVSNAHFQNMKAFAKILIENGARIRDEFVHFERRNTFFRWDQYVNFNARQRPDAPVIVKRRIEELEKLCNAAEKQQVAKVGK